MTVRFGTDIVHIPTFGKTLQRTREYFAQNVFYPEELEGANVQRLASIFASKEAVIKAWGLQAGQWREIRVAYEESGKPYLATFPQPKETPKQWKHELAIAHDGDYAIATVIFYR